MRLYDIDYHSISDEDRKIWEELTAKEIVQHAGKLTIRKSLYHDFPKSARHYMSLFPNNFVDSIDLRKSSDQLKSAIYNFSILLNEPETTERTILNFIRDNTAYFIIGSLLKNNYNFGHHSLYLFPEFQMPPNYQADYLLVGQNSDGYHFVFIELESAYGNITISNGDYGLAIRKGISQINDWDIWLERNFSNLNLVFESFLNKSKQLPNEFRYFDKSRIHYVVVAGRRSDYSERTYRLRRNNQQQQNLLILHYDNLIDSASAIIGESTY